jgi:hypothetical protein
LHLALDGAFAAIRVGVGEIGRAAQHGHGEAGVVNGLADPVEISCIQPGEKPVVHLQPVGVERARHLDPVKDRHRALACDLVDVAFREGRELQRHGTLSLLKKNHENTKEENTKKTLVARMRRVWLLLLTSSLSFFVFS